MGNVKNVGFPLCRTHGVLARATVSRPTAPYVPTPAAQELLTRHRATGRDHELFLSVNTVKSQLNSVYRKLDVKDRTGAVVKAKQLGL